MTEDHACGAIMDWERVRRGILLPRYSPADWWECDVFELTGAGYFREYEVKLTLADFKRDGAKRREKWNGFGQPAETFIKHEMLAKGDARGPAEFFFVAPVGLITPVMLPLWAGLIELHDRGPSWRPSIRWLPTTVVKAPRLHREKAVDGVRISALSCCYYRLHDLFRVVRDRTAAPTEWNDEEAPVTNAV